MLSADFGHLDRDTRMIDRSAAEWVHIDVMDGVFVPNISFGFPVMKPIRKATSKFLDVHLMIVEPEKYVARFVEAGADPTSKPPPIPMGASPASAGPERRSASRSSPPRRSRRSARCFRRSTWCW